MDMFTQLINSHNNIKCEDQGIFPLKNKLHYSKKQFIAPFAERNNLESLYTNMSLDKFISDSNTSSNINSSTNTNNKVDNERRYHNNLNIK